MRTLFSLTFIFCTTFFSYSQVVKEVNARIFSIVHKRDTIYFLKTNTCLIQKKPTIIFCQGSSPAPLIINLGKEKFIPALNNFKYLKLSEKYNFIVISMPHTPPVVDKEKLNNRYEYVPNVKQENKFDSLYMRDNYKENYVERANCVIRFLKKQKWVDKSKIAVVGHSQGSYIAATLAVENKSIKALGYFAGNPDGRFTQLIREARRAALNKKISAQQAQNGINKFYKTWSFYCKGINIDSIGLEHIKTWKSFTYSAREELVKLKTPIYVAYGTEDLDHSESCDLLPIYFERAGKTNYKMMPWVGCGHNFEEISPEGVSNYDKMHWDDVMNSFVDWFEKL